MEKQTIKEMLKAYSVVAVTFTKKDSSIRKMYCTQDMDYIPEDSRPKPKAEGEEPAKVLSDDVARVYDFEAKGWRSFAYDSVIEMGFHEPRNAE